jgi:DNA-binding beta-propeller fold protein YncE
MKTHLLFGVAIATLAMAGCSGSSGAVSRLVMQSSAERAGHTRPATTQTLYVGSDDGIAAYDLSTYALNRSYGVSTGVSAPEALAQDASGNLWVGNDGFNNVLEFAAGSTKLLQTITNGILEPTAIAFDPAGNVYVANRGPVSRNSNDVTVYSPSGTLLRTIIAGIQYPTHLAFDSQGNLYVANGGGPVTEYDGGLKKLTRTISGTNQSFFILFDAADDLYVSNCSLRCKSPSIVEYGPQGKGVLRTITDGLRNPLSMALDSTGNLYVADANFGDRSKTCFVTAYAPDQTSPSEKITDGVHDAQGVVVDGSDNLYVMNFNGLCKGKFPGGVTVYPPGSTTFTHKLKKSIYRPLAIIVGM